MSEGNVILNIYTNPDFLPANSLDQEIQGLLEVVPPSTSSSPTTGADIVLLLDSSGSMNEGYYNTGLSKRQAVVEALRSMLPELRDQDTLSIISFNTMATLLLDHQRKSASTQIEQSIQDYFHQNGNTNFEAAMQAAWSVCQKKVNPIKKIIFLTDGHPYGGNTNTALSTAQTIARDGLATLDAMGIGENFNFDLMRLFSAPSGGITENLVNTSDARNVFRSILRSTQQTIAVNIQLQILFGTHVRDIEIYQTAPEKRSMNKNSSTSPAGTFYQMFAGDLSAGATKQFAIRCRTDLPDASFVKLADLALTYRLPSEADTIRTEISWNLSLSSDNSQIRYDSFVIDRFREIELLTGLEQALKLYGSNHIPEALKKLDSLLGIARSLGDIDQERILQTAYDKIVRNENLTQADLNRMLHRSSRASRVRTQAKTDKKKL